MSHLEQDRDKTIRDFGDQWSRHTRNEGYYADAQLLADIVSPFLTLDDFRGSRCADIGSGTGRIVLMMLAAGAGSVTAVEPSRAYDVLLSNTAHAGERVRALSLRGDEIPAEDFDIILSIGVLHHIPDPAPVVAAAHRALKDGGRMVVWLYGHEGSSAYRLVFLPLRALTRRLPFAVNNAIAAMIYPFTLAYAALVRRFPGLPLSDYVRNVYMKFGPAERRLVIVDQINPQWAKYYTRDEAHALLTDAGFADVEVHHRHGYSWTVSGVKRG